MLFEVEKILIHSLGWPQWALKTIEILLLLVLFLTLFQLTQQHQQQTKQQIKERKEENKEHKKELKKEFYYFQFKYLIVYFIVMLADWLQGTNMYTLYSSYNVNIGYLFLTGFLSSAIFGTFLGIYIDSWGRKFGCILFCILEV